MVSNIGTAFISGLGRNFEKQTFSGGLLWIFVDSPPCDERGFTAAVRMRDVND